VYELLFVWKKQSGFCMGWSSVIVSFQKEFMLRLFLDSIMMCLESEAFCDIPLCSCWITYYW
jgi:hypothetical protein